MGSVLAGAAMSLLLMIATATPAAAVCGDADASTSVTATDALAALRSSVSLASTCTPTFCDVNRSETITASDALIILGYAVGVETDLRCGGSGLVDLDACNSDTFFSVSPVADQNIQASVPLGNLSPTDHTFPTDHIYFFLPESSGFINRDFSDVTADGNIYCYDHTSGAVLVQMTSGERLLIEHQPATDCNNANYAMTANATAFVR